MNPGDLNVYYEQLGLTPEMHQALAAIREAAPAAPLPQPISKAESRAVALARNIERGGTRIFYSTPCRMYSMVCFTNMAMS